MLFDLLRLLQGRSFSSLNPDERREETIVVSKTFADRWWPAGGAVGKRMKWGPPDSENPWMTVIGVVEDVDDREPGSGPDPGCYIPSRSRTPNGMYLALRTNGDPLDLVDSLKAAVWRDDADLPLVEIRSMESIARQQYWPIVLALWLMGIFSFITLSLAAVGIYAVISYSVSRRTREMGIRIAMGAGAGQIVRTVLGRVARISGIGLVTGMLLAFVVLRILASQLYGIVADDLATYFLVTVVLGGAALLAGWVPARRAGRIDPMEALRAE